MLHLGFVGGQWRRSERNVWLHLTTLTELLPLWVPGDGIRISLTFGEIARLTVVNAKPMPSANKTMLAARAVCLLGSMVLVMGVIIKAACVLAYWRACTVCVSRFTYISCFQGGITFEIAREEVMNAIYALHDITHLRCNAGI